MIYVLYVALHCGWFACRDVYQSPPMSQSECFTAQDRIKFSPDDASSSYAICIPRVKTP